VKLLNEIPDYLVPDSIRGSVRLGIPQPPEWQRIGNQIDAAMIFAGAGLRKDAQASSIALALHPSASIQVQKRFWRDPERGKGHSGG